MQCICVACERMGYVSISKDVFILSDVNADYDLVYSPLRGIVFRVVHEAEPFLIQYIENKDCAALSENWKLKSNLDTLLSTDYTVPSYVEREKNSVVFIPTQRCNLDCSYCYAHLAHADEDLPFSCVAQCLNVLFSHDVKSTKRISFIGGGEPTLKWSLIKETVEHINLIKKDTPVQISIATNGTLLSSEKIAFLKDNGIRVSLSFDILPSVQNEQRPFANKRGSFESVNQTINLLINGGIIPSIRTTITPISCGKMPEMVEFVNDRYPEIKQIHLEHVSDASMSLSDLHMYYNEFCDGFWKARKLGREYGINVKNSLTTALQHLRYTFCGGELCVTPNKNIVACHRISSERDKYFDSMRYGYIGEDAIVIDEDANRIIRKRNDLRDEKCKVCFARWHCAGGCPYNKMMLDSQQLTALCEFTKKMITHGLSNSVPIHDELKSYS